MNAKLEIQNLINSALKKIGIEEDEILVEYPMDEKNGDFATNVAMQLSKELKKNPRKIAEDIIESIEKPSFIDKIEIAGPGFINFFLTNKYLSESITKIDKDFGKTDILNSKNTIVEWTDPNPFKELHIGHLYQLMLGESIALLHENAGSKVMRVTYQGDVGMHVAKSIWGIIKKLEESGKDLDSLENLNINEKVNFLGQSYAFGATAYKDEEKAQEEIKEINLLVYLASQNRLVDEENWTPQVDYSELIKTKNFDIEQIESIYRVGRKWSLDYFKKIYDRVGVTFDKNYFESVTGEYGVKIVREYMKKNIFENSDGAVIFPGEKYGLHTRVFINSFGLPTYETKELGLAPTKFKDFEYDISIIITGNEIKEYFKVLLKAMSFTNPELSEKTKNLTNGMLRLPEGAMSSRTGKILRAEWLLDEAKNKVAEYVKEKNYDEEKLEQISQAAVKYAFLKNRVGEDFNFDFDSSISFEGNSGPYLQYTHARANSIISKAGEIKENMKEFELNEDERLLLVLANKFPEITSESLKKLSPHILCEYLYDLASKFNAFYNKYSILNAEIESDVYKRVQITNAIKNILSNGLNLLGINAPESM